MLLTNSFRDFISGDMISGLLHFSEAIITAVYLRRLYNSNHPDGRFLMRRVLLCGSRVLSAHSGLRFSLIRGQENPDFRRWRRRLLGGFILFFSTSWIINTWDFFYRPFLSQFTPRYRRIFKDTGDNRADADRNSFYPGRGALIMR